MLVIPAIDLKDGRCVRLWQGRKEAETVYSDDPLEIAGKWVAKGTSRIHIVDLDGAFSGEPKHLGIVEKIKRTFSVKIEYGGGIRNLNVLKNVMEKGIDYAIVGTGALSSDFIGEAVQEFGEKIIVSIDCKKGKVAVEGWEVDTRTDAITLGKDLSQIGVRTIIMTDISKDGTLTGINIPFIRKFLREVPCDIILAGGVSSLEDVKEIKNLRTQNLLGVIIGKALYSHTIDLEDVLKIAR